MDAQPGRASIVLDILLGPPYAFSPWRNEAFKPEAPGRPGGAEGED